MSIFNSLCFIFIGILFSKGDAYKPKHGHIRPTMSIKLSPMVENMAISKTIEIHAMTKELEKSGKKIFSLCVGEPDYQPPQSVLAATMKAAEKGITKYTAVNGEAALRQAIAKDLQARKGLSYSPEQLVVANGAKQAVLQALLSLVSPGDQVIVPAPYWTSYPDMVKMCQAEPVYCQTSASLQYQLTAAALRQCLTAHPKVSCIILCNPSNPTGCVTSENTLREIANVLKDFPKVMVISDEIYERLLYDKETHTSFAAIDKAMYDRTVTVNGFSKSHAMTGFRLGYSASPLPIAKAIGKLQSQITSCASSISQVAALAALEDPLQEEWLSLRLQELQEKRDLGFKLLHDIPHVSCPKPTGAFYLLPDVSYYYGKKYVDSKDGSEMLIKGSHELSVALLKSEGVALVGGEAFGDDRCIRISYATSTDIIQESLVRLKRFLLSLQS